MTFKTCKYFSKKSIRRISLRLGYFRIAKQIEYAFNQKDKKIMAKTCCVTTPYMMAPEILNNRKYDQKVDIWALGFILYEIKMKEDTMTQVYMVEEGNPSGLLSLNKEKKNSYLDIVLPKQIQNNYQISCFEEYKETLYNIYFWAIITFTLFTYIFLLSDSKD